MDSSIQLILITINEIRALAQIAKANHDTSKDLCLQLERLQPLLRNAEKYANEMTKVLFDQFLDKVLEIKAFLTKFTHVPETRVEKVFSGLGKLWKLRRTMNKLISYQQAINQFYLELSSISGMITAHAVSDNNASKSTALVVNVDRSKMIRSMISDCNVSTMQALVQVESDIDAGHDLPEHFGLITAYYTEAIAYTIDVAEDVEIVKEIKALDATKVITHKSDNIISKSKMENRPKVDHPVIYRSIQNDYEAMSEKRLGRGQFGDVFKMKHKATGKIIAAKQIDIKGANRQNVSIESIIQEANLLSRMNHVNIIRLYDHNYYDEKKEIYCLILELVNGQEMSSFVSCDEELSPKRLQSWLKQIFSGLSYMHGEGILHRDIKPENIMVDSNDLIKIVDFGLARSYDLGVGNAHTKVGSGPYYSYEKTIGNYDSRDDVWAVGCIFLELILKQFLVQIVHQPRILIISDPSNGDLLDAKLDECERKQPEFSRYLRLCLHNDLSERPFAAALLLEVERMDIDMNRTIPKSIRKPLHELSVAEVGAFLRSLAYSDDIVKLFVRNHVGGCSLSRVAKQETTFEKCGLNLSTILLDEAVNDLIEQLKYHDKKDVPNEYICNASLITAMVASLTSSDHTSGKNPSQLGTFSGSTESLKQSDSTYQMSYDDINVRRCSASSLGSSFGQLRTLSYASENDVKMATSSSNEIVDFNLSMGSITSQRFSEVSASSEMDTNIPGYDSRQDAPTAVDVSRQSASLKAISLDSENVSSPSGSDPSALWKAFVDAVTYGRENELTRILSEKIIPIDNYFSSRRDTALHVASKKGFDYIVELLIDNHAKILKDEDGQTPLHYACQHRYYAVVKTIVSRYDDKDTLILDPDIFQLTPLHYACSGKSASIDTVQYFLSTLKTIQNLDVTNKEGFTPLHCAARDNHVDILELLINSRKFNINAKTKTDKQTPLHLACVFGHEHVVRLLLDRNADCTLKDKKLRKAIDLAKDNAAIQELLRR